MKSQGSFEDSSSLRARFVAFRLHCLPASQLPLPIKIHLLHDLAFSLPRSHSYPSPQTLQLSSKVINSFSIHLLPSLNPSRSTSSIFIPPLHLSILHLYYSHSYQAAHCQHRDSSTNPAHIIESGGVNSLVGHILSSYLYYCPVIYCIFYPSTQSVSLICILTKWPIL